MSSETLNGVPVVAPAPAKPENPFLAAFRPYIPAAERLRELTPLPMVVGTLLGMVFGASSLYLVLKVGLTVSASIPVAVLSITLFRLFSKVGLRNATILENNIVQTAGSAGESIAFGVGVTMPAILILGFDLELTRVMLVAVLGGLLGILMMIPLRRALIVQQHGLLKYPEGTACAEVLKAGASEESREAASHEAKAEAAARGKTTIGAKTIFTGFGIGLVYQTAMKALYGWKEVPEKIFDAPFKAAAVGAEISPALLGVGYIIGPRIASIMAAGGVLSFLVLIPAIKFFGEGIIPPATKPISDMGTYDIYNAYILYIGAGAVAAGGIISLGRSLPVIWSGLRGGISDLRSRQSTANGAPRTDRDLSMRFVLAGIIVLVLLIMSFPQLNLGWTGVGIVGAVLIIIFGFLFVTVSSRLTGEIGSSSNPISGMTVATLLLTCLVFLVIGWTSAAYFVTALSIGGIVCIAASNGGTTSQDLKTGFIVGSTPRAQQIAIIIGALASALILGPILLRLNDAATVYVPLPHATYTQFTGDVAPLEQEIVSGLPAHSEPGKYQGGPYRLLGYAAGDRVLMNRGIQPGEYLVDESGKIAYRIDRLGFPQDFRVNPSEMGRAEQLQGPQSQQDSKTYHVWHRTDRVGAPSGLYLVNDQGVPAYFVDPGINGTYRERPDGTTVDKFRAPKATLMAYIIQGILSRELPWGLVLLGVMIAIVLEMSGIPSLAFAVGVYLPLSSSSPIFVGGMVRLMVDRSMRKRLRHKNLTEEQLVAEGDKSPGVLMASGYIAGGALASIIIAFMAGVLVNVNRDLTDWSTENNPFFRGQGLSDLLSLVPFAILIVLLYLTGRELILAGRNDNVKT